MKELTAAQMDAVEAEASRLYAAHNPDSLNVVNVGMRQCRDEAQKKLFPHNPTILEKALRACTAVVGLSFAWAWFTLAFAYPASWVVFNLIDKDAYWTVVTIAGVCSAAFMLGT